MQDSQLSLGNGYDVFLETLANWGVRVVSGVTGGGVIHLLKHLSPTRDEQSQHGPPSFFNIGEYVAGYVPLGYFFATNKVAAAIATTGAATKLLSCGLSDAKLHDVPAIYLLALSSNESTGRGPLQDTSQYGSNMVQQLLAELPDSVFVLDDPQAIPDQLHRAWHVLQQRAPVVMFLSHDALAHVSFPSNRAQLPRSPRPDNSTSDFISLIRREVPGKRLIILVGEELASYPNAAELTSRLCEALKAPVVWSINGANAIARNNRYGYGYVSFGGNDLALELWNSLNEDDVLLGIGVCPDEYTANLEIIPVAHAFFVSELPRGYGKVEGSLRHFVQGECEMLIAPLDQAIRSLIEGAEEQSLQNVPFPEAPRELNTTMTQKPRPGYVDMAELYRRLDDWWKPGSIGIDDVCLAYKDRQYVTQRPNDNIRFHSLYRGSAMGGAFGVAVGAKLGDRSKNVYLFTGDGCFRLFAGCLTEASSLGIVLFLLNNERYSIVDQGLTKILPEVDRERYHADLRAMNHCAIARASGWDAVALSADLSNLEELLETISVPLERSILIDVPVDPEHELGANPRLRHL